MLTKILVTPLASLVWIFLIAKSYAAYFLRNRDDLGWFFILVMCAATSGAIFIASSMAGVLDAALIFVAMFAAVMTVFVWFMRGCWTNIRKGM